MPINEFRAIDTFARAVALGSIRRAAVALGVSPQAASQSLAQLEKHLGVRLLHRTTRSLALTDEGQRFLEATQPALAALDRALNRAREAKDEIAGPLRIVGPKSSFSSVLMPLLDEFCKLYPDIQPNVQLEQKIAPDLMHSVILYKIKEYDAMDNTVFIGIRWSAVAAPYMFVRNRDFCYLEVISIRR